MDDIVATETTRRDRYGRYLVVPPDGGKPVGYTRATTIAKTLVDTSSLMAWGVRRTAIGLSRRPDILAQIDADLDKQTLNRLCAAAKEAGGATIRRDLGTALHSILERSWTDSAYRPPAAHQADVDAVHQALRDAHLNVVEGMNERIVVNDRHKIAGTFDLILEDKFGRLFIADIKTGSSVNYGALGFAVQLSIYATADNLYTQGAAADGSDDIRQPLPDVSTDLAVIIHVEPGSGICTLHRLTLDTDLVDLAMTVRHARNRKNLIAELATEQTRDEWVRERIADITDKERLRAVWPADVPPPKRHTAPYTDTQIDMIVAALQRVETATSAPFGMPDPATPPPQPRTTRHTPPPAVVEYPEEGDEDPRRFEQLMTMWSEMDEAQRSWVNLRVVEANSANLPIRVKGTPTRRRLNIAEGLFRLSSHLHTRSFLDVEQQARDLLAVALDDDTALMPTLPLGAAIGLLDADQSGVWLELIELGATVENETQTN